MKNLVRLNIIEHICYDPPPCNSTLLIETDDLKDLKDRIQAAYLDYIKTLDFEDMDAAKEEGVYFGNSFHEIPKELQKKYDFYFVKEDAVIDADFDYGCESCNW